MLKLAYNNGKRTIGNLSYTILIHSQACSYQYLRIVNTNSPTRQCLLLSRISSDCSELIYRVQNKYGLGFYSLKGEGKPLFAYVTSDYKKFYKDTHFSEVWDKAKSHTLLDVLRAHELWSLVSQTSKLDRGGYLEVGVWRGGSAFVIAKAMQHFSVSESLYLADTFSGVV